MQMPQHGRKGQAALFSMIMLAICAPTPTSTQVLGEAEPKKPAHPAPPYTYDKPDFTVPLAGVNAECVPMTTDQAIASVRQAYMDAFNTGDADAVAALHTESSVHMPAGLAAVTGRESIRDLMTESLSGMPPGVEFEFEPRDLRVADGWAVERGVTKAVPPFPAGKYVMLYEKESDGCWRIAWTITNSDAPPPPR